MIRKGVLFFLNFRDIGIFLIGKRFNGYVNIGNVFLIIFLSFYDFERNRDFGISILLEGSIVGFSYILDGS